MRLTTKGHFAVTAMIGLALRQEQGPVTLVDISQRQKISLSYLEQLFSKLRRHEIVESVHGLGGGYSPARRIGDVTIADIIITMDEPLDATQCGGEGNCGSEEHVGDRTGHYMIHDLWATFDQKTVEYLSSVSLQNLVDRQRKHRPEVTQDMREVRPARREHTLTHTRAVDTPATTSMTAGPVKRAPLINSAFSLAQS